MAYNESDRLFEVSQQTLARLDELAAKRAEMNGSIHRLEKGASESLCRPSVLRDRAYR
jgi:hypothetical protein